MERRREENNGEREREENNGEREENQRLIGNDPIRGSPGADQKENHEYAS